MITKANGQYNDGKQVSLNWSLLKFIIEGRVITNFTTKKYIFLYSIFEFTLIYSFNRDEIQRIHSDSETIHSLFFLMKRSMRILVTCQ